MGGGQWVLNRFTRSQSCCSTRETCSANMDVVFLQTVGTMWLSKCREDAQQTTPIRSVALTQFVAGAGGSVG